MPPIRGGAVTCGADGDRGNPHERAFEAAPSMDEVLCFSENL